MKKFKVIVPIDYVQGHLRYGHKEAIIEAETIEEAKQQALEYEDYDIEVDDYEISDYGASDFESMTIEEVKE